MDITVRNSYARQRGKQEKEQKRELCCNNLAYVARSKEGGKEGKRLEAMLKGRGQLVI